MHILLALSKLLSIALQNRVMHIRRTAKVQNNQYFNCLHNYAMEVDLVPWLGTSLSTSTQITCRSDRESTWCKHRLWPSPLQKEWYMYIWMVADNVVGRYVDVICPKSCWPPSHAHRLSTRKTIFTWKPVASMWKVRNPMLCLYACIVIPRQVCYRLPIVCMLWRCVL